MLTAMLKEALPEAFRYVICQFIQTHVVPMLGAMAFNKRLGEVLRGL
jgi:hypothetical protein